MAGREKPKRKALHRGLDDIINRDASLTSRLLGRVKPPSREPLEGQATGEIRKPAAEPEKTALAAEDVRGAAPLTVKQPGAVRPVEKSESAQPIEDEEVVPRAPSSVLRQGTADLIKPERQRAATVRAVRDSDAAPVPVVNSKVAPAPSGVLSFENFVARWGVILRSGGRAGKLRICEVLYDNTYAVGRETFFTSYEKLAKLTNLEKKQCSINIRQLEALGFVERLNIYNTATRQGTEFKLHLEQLPPGERRTPVYHCYDEDLK